MPFVKMIGRFVPKGWPQVLNKVSVFCLLLMVVLRFKKMRQHLT